MTPKKKSKPNQNGAIEVGGNYIQGNVNIKGGQLAGRDIITTNITTGGEWFQPVYQTIKGRKDTPEPQKAELMELAKQVEQEVKKPQPHEGMLSLLLKDIGKIAPDILEVATTTLMNPAAGLSLVAKKVVEKASQVAKPASPSTG